MAENYIDAENDYMLGMKYRDIAAKYGVTINTVKSWKQRYRWSRKKGMHTEEKKVCTQKSKGAEKEDAPKEIYNSNLNDNQKLFCLYYVKYRNKVKAYQKAYQCSYENACSHASNLWKKDGIQHEISHIMEEIRRDIRVDIIDLIQQQIDIARADITDFADISSGTVRIKRDFDGALVREIKDTPTGISIKLYDKQKAIDFLKDNLPDEIEGHQGECTETLADIVLHSRPNRNLADYE